MVKLINLILHCKEKYALNRDLNLLMSLDNKIYLFKKKKKVIKRKF